jgi:hypothetical protein
VYFDTPSILSRVYHTPSSDSTQPPVGIGENVKIAVVPPDTVAARCGKKIRKRHAMTKNRATFLYFMVSSLSNEIPYLLISI